MAHEIAPRIVADANIRFGKPVISGTRVPVETVISKLAGGMRPEEVAEEYEISLEDLRAALSYAASVLASEGGRGVACTGAFLSDEAMPGPPDRGGAGAGKVWAIGGGWRGDGRQRKTRN